MAGRIEEDLHRTRPTLSVVVPAHNEAESLPRLVDEIVAALMPLCVGSSGNFEGRSVQIKLEKQGGRAFAKQASRPLKNGFEIVIVDDGSTDATRDVLRELQLEYPELKTIVLERNIGQSGALVVGIGKARGKWIAMLDADLQNDPADLAKLWKSVSGYDAALGFRVNRRDPASKRWIGRIANRVRNIVLGQGVRDTGCSLRIVKRSAMIGLPSFRGMHRFIGSLLIRDGRRFVQVPVGHRPRINGKTHYNIWNRSIQVIVDLFGVWWLCRRALPRVIDRLGNEAESYRGDGFATTTAGRRGTERWID
jgi:dolichol-phosphate mannosyltransferase